MFSLNETTLINAVSGGGLLSVVNSVVSPGYGIYYASGEKIGKKPIMPKSFVIVEFTGDASISTAPKEKGKYSSFNKIQRPPELHLTFTVEGWTGFSGSVPNLTDFTLSSRSDVLATLETMRTSADIYDIETPDTTYTSYDLTKYDYRIRADSGVTMLTVTAIFQSVVDTAEVTVSSDTSQAGTTSNDTAQGANGVITVNTTSTTATATMADVKKALAGLTASLTDSAVTVADSASSALQKASETVTGALSDSVISSTNQLSNAISLLAGKIT